MFSLFPVIKVLLECLDNKDIFNILKGTKVKDI